MIIKEDHELFKVLTVHHATPGNKRGFVQVKIRNLKSGIQKEKRYGSTERVEKASLEHRPMEYLYDDGSEYHFMDTQSHEQISFSHEHVGGLNLFLSPNQMVDVVFYEGKPMGVELPSSVELRVTQTVPGLKTATVTSSNKPATLETGLQVQVPQFIKEGDTVRVDTATQEYIERVKK